MVRVRAGMETEKETILTAQAEQCNADRTPGKQKSDAVDRALWGDDTGDGRWKTGLSVAGKERSPGGRE